VVNHTLEGVIAAVPADLALVFFPEEDQIPHAGRLSDQFIYDQSPLRQIGDCLWSAAASQDGLVCSSEIPEDQHKSIEACRQAGIESFAGIPLTIRGKTLAVLGIFSSAPADFNGQAKFLGAFAAQAASGLQAALLSKLAREEINKRKKAEMQIEIHRLQMDDVIHQHTLDLERRVQELQEEVSTRVMGELTEREQRTLAEALIDASTVLNSTLDLNDVLDRILINLENVVPHDSATVMLMGEDRDVAYIARYKGRDQREPAETTPRSRFVIQKTATFQKMEDTRKPLIIPDVKEDSDWVDVQGSEWIQAYIGAPIILDEEVIGFLNLVSSKPYFFTSTHAVRLRAFANHAAIAIQNARVYDQARKLAILEERQRLARDMHDVVSQTLFTTSVVAEALPIQWERDPEKGREGLERLRRLTKGALAEMRTLLIELRPEALTKADLGDLILQIAEGAKSRAEFEIECAVVGRGSLPAEVQGEMFRIVQEVFNNIIKHARASQVTIQYEKTEQGVYLLIRDDGRGFDPGQIKDDRFGLRIMRERAEGIGADLKIDSGAVKGTSVEIKWAYD
jgi:two-component system nitrate/nitrite sensor histidine kinase NarX